MKLIFVLGKSLALNIRPSPLLGENFVKAQLCNHPADFELQTIFFFFKLQHLCYWEAQERFLGILNPYGNFES